MPSRASDASPENAPLEHSSTSRADVLARVAAEAGSNSPLPRLLIVLAHPDDEVLAMGARLERLRSSRLLTVTDGVPEDGDDARQHGFASLASYREARRHELGDALAHAGLPVERVLSPPKAPLPVPDQTAALHLAALARAIAAHISEFQPEAVLTHPYEGGHPDHDACAFAVHAAVRVVEAAGRPQPAIVEAPFYHAGEDGSMSTGQFLASTASALTLVHQLSPREQANKRARLACFVSQVETLRQFGTVRELFRMAPGYDFTQPPHPGTLLYERFPWGMTGERFRALGAQASADLHRVAFAGVTPIPPQKVPA